MPQYLKTTGDRLHDLELDSMLARIKALEASANAPAAVSQAPPATVVSQSVAGISSVSPGALTGDVTLAGAGAVSVNSAAQTITMTVTLGTSTSAIAAAGAAGTSSSVARADHTHEGVHSIAAQQGDVSMAGIGAAVVSGGGGSIAVAVPFASTVTPVGSTAAVGSSANVAHEDHAHVGVHSCNSLNGDISIVSAGGCTVSVVGTQIKISVP